LGEQGWGVGVVLLLFEREVSSSDSSPGMLGLILRLETRGCRLGNMRFQLFEPFCYILDCALVYCIAGI
jgi:hypothetical protein